MFTHLKCTTAGESHGPMLTAILDGMVAGLPIDVDAINHELARRQKGYGSGGRMKIEKDAVQITGGVMAGQTTGAPISLLIKNRDAKNWDDKPIAPMNTPRPGHADLAGAIKYGHADLRLSLERASARETAARVAMGAIAKQLLRALGIRVVGWTQSIGGVVDETANPHDAAAIEEHAVRALTNDLCVGGGGYEAMREAIKQCRKAQDTLGGVVEVFALDVPVGLGSYTQWDRRLEARLAMAVMSVQAFKGVEVGTAFENAQRRGSEVHDEIDLDPSNDQELTRGSNRAGGIEGGMSNGMPIHVRAAMKPISTTLNPRRSVDLSTGVPAATTYERSDFCAVARAVPIIEAMVALTLADALLEKVGGDSLTEVRERVERLPKNTLDAVSLRNAPWKF